MGWSTCGTIGKLARDNKLAFTPYFHGREAFIPSRDYLAELKLGGLAEVVRVIELLAVTCQPPYVMDHYSLPERGAGTITDLEILDL